MKKETLMYAAAGLTAFYSARAIWRVWQEFELAGRTVLITGGSRGLGLVMAREFAREGARIVICARDSAELERARLDLTGRGADVLALRCDITKHDEVDEMVR